jgi:RNA polymerase sigma-70 factor (ECF subfamily)
MDGPTESPEDQLVALVPAVRRWLYRLVGPGPDFDDAVQEALVEVARALPRFEGRSKLTTYAHPIVLRSGYKAIARRKRRRNEEDVAALDRVAAPHDPEDQAHHRGQLEHLHRVLDQLSEAQRGAFILVNVERLSHDEAADREGVSLETLRKRLTRGRAELARRLAADPELVAMLKGTDA